MSTMLFYYNVTIPEVQYSINTSIGKSFEKKNQELRISEYQFKKVAINIAISEVFSKKNNYVIQVK